MNLTSLLLTLLIAFGLLACQQSGPSGKGTAPAGPVGGPSPAGGGTGSSGTPAPWGSGQLGGADPVGGGNGIDNKTFERYRAYMSSNEAYKRVHEKVLKKLIVKFPRLAADLIFVAHHKTWFLIPTPLNQLPAYRIGVSFKEPQQLALQKPHEIWIDLRFYREMSDEDQESLILHEIVMGARLLVFANPLERCLVDIEVLTFKPELAKEYEAKRKECYVKNNYIVKLGTAKWDKEYHLDDHDYPFIRKLTSDLTDQIDSLKPSELEFWMELNGFRSYTGVPMGTEQSGDAPPEAAKETASPKVEEAAPSKPETKDEGKQVIKAKLP